MHCQNCGAELANGVKYCSECGSKVSGPVVSFCTECGARLPIDATVCEYCGSPVVPSDTITWMENPGKDKKSAEVSRSSKQTMTSSKAKKRTKGAQTRKAIRIVLFALTAFAILVIGGTIALKMLQRTADSSGPVIPESAPSLPAPASSQTDESDEDGCGIIKGSQYAYMSDPWNVYIATGVSDSIIKIECWHRTKTNDKQMDYRYDVGVIKVEEGGSGFYWVDGEHTAFVISFSDERNSRVSSPQPHVFTININENNRCKGSDYDAEVTCYRYANDRWHEYRAIPLSGTLIKIECWYRTSASDDFSFGYDWCVIDTSNSNTGFEWTDDEHTSFTMTTVDVDNNQWEEPSFVLFELDNPNSKYPDVVSYLEAQDGNWWNLFFHFAA